MVKHTYALTYSLTHTAHPLAWVSPGLYSRLSVSSWIIHPHLAWLLCTIPAPTSVLQSPLFGKFLNNRSLRILWFCTRHFSYQKDLSTLFHPNLSFSWGSHVFFPPAFLRYGWHIKLFSHMLKLCSKAGFSEKPPSEKLGWQTPPMLCEFPPSPDSLIHECPVVPHLLGSSSPAWLVTAFFSRQPLNLSIGRALGAWNDNPGSPGLGESVSTSPWWPLCKVLFTFEFCVKFGRLYVDAEASFHWNA